MNLSQPFREAVEKVSVAISDTFDHVAAKAKALWNIEHLANGRHGTIVDLTATNATIGTATITTETVTTSTVTTQTVETLTVTEQLTVTGGTLIAPTDDTQNGVNIQLLDGGDGIPFVTLHNEDNILARHSGYSGGNPEILGTVLLLSAGGLTWQARNNANTGGSFTWKDAAGNTLVTFAAAGVTVGGTLGVTGDVAVNTNKFTVTAASGNTAIAGDLAIATNKFNVAAASGATQSASSILSTSATAGVGYTTGAGGTVTQLTSKVTGVTLNKITGQITMNNAALAGGARASFVVTNSAVAATDTVVVTVVGSGGVTAYAYAAAPLQVDAGSFAITVVNITGGSLSEAVVINFAIIKGATS